MKGALSIGIAGGGVSIDNAGRQDWTGCWTRRGEGRALSWGGGSGALLRVGKRENLLCPSSRPLHSSDEFPTIHFFKWSLDPTWGLNSPLRDLEWSSMLSRYSQQVPPAPFSRLLS